MLNTNQQNEDEKLTNTNHQNQQNQTNQANNSANNSLDSSDDDSGYYSEEDDLDSPFIFTDAAAQKVRELMEDEGNPNLKLRVFVQGGGCSGFQYGFTFEDESNEDDTIIYKDGVTLLVDSMSYQYLLGAEIDYKDDVTGAQFIIKNPNATTTCGCGSSFSV